jgi:hypothetical protein
LRLSSFLLTKPEPVIAECSSSKLLCAQTGAIFASTPWPEAAKFFMSWIASGEFQAKQSSTQYALQTDEISPLLSNRKQLSGLRLFEQDHATVEWWKNQFEDSIGTPQGPSPLAVYPNPVYQGWYAVGDFGFGS